MPVKAGQGDKIPWALYRHMRQLRYSAQRGTPCRCGFQCFSVSLRPAYRNIHPVRSRLVDLRPLLDGIYCLLAFSLTPFAFSPSCPVASRLSPFCLYPRACRLTPYAFIPDPLAVISVLLQMIPLRVFEPGFGLVHKVDDFSEDKVMYLFLLGDLQKRCLFIFIL